MWKLCTSHLTPLTNGYFCIAPREILRRRSRSQRRRPAPQLRPTRDGLRQRHECNAKASAQRNADAETQNAFAHSIYVPWCTGSEQQRWRQSPEPDDSDAEGDWPQQVDLRDRRLRLPAGSSVLSSRTKEHFRPFAATNRQEEADGRGSPSRVYGDPRPLTLSPHGFSGGTSGLHVSPRFEKIRV